jgi:hypothetical protein
MTPHDRDLCKRVADSTGTPDSDVDLDGKAWDAFGELPYTWREKFEREYEAKEKVPADIAASFAHVREIDARKARVLDQPIRIGDRGIRNRRPARQTRSNRTVVTGRRRQSASRVGGSRSKGDDGPASDGDPPGRPKSHQPRGVAIQATFTRGGSR